MSAWIKMISDEDADADVLDALSFSRTPHGTVDNVMRVHSLRPNPKRGHVVLYRAALHDENNTLPIWLQETISSYVSILNCCEYSLANHWANARHLINDNNPADDIKAALDDRTPARVFEGAELALMQYAEILTLSPGEIMESDIVKLRENRFNDGEILEANQIICHFNYVNRSLNGLGVTTDNDVVGYYANEDLDS
jgi:uncharacterized peroxidase-related enzyme